MKSIAGFYIGRFFTDDQGFEEPGSRESGYFKSRDAAQKALDDGFEVRRCIENDFAYNNGILPDIRGK